MRIFDGRYILLVENLPVLSESALRRCLAFAPFWRHQFTAVNLPQGQHGSSLRKIQKKMKTYRLRIGNAETVFETEEKHLPAAINEAAEKTGSAKGGISEIVGKLEKLGDCPVICACTPDAGWTMLEIVPPTQVLEEDERLFLPDSTETGVIYGPSVERADLKVVGFADRMGLSLVEIRYNHWPGSTHRIVYCQFPLGRKLETVTARMDDPQCCGRNSLTIFRLAEDGQTGDWVDGPYGPTILLHPHPTGRVVGVSRYGNNNDLGRKAEDGFARFQPARIEVRRLRSVFPEDISAQTSRERKESYQGKVEVPPKIWERAGMALRGSLLLWENTYLTPEEAEKYFPGYGDFLCPQLKDEAGAFLDGSLKMRWNDYFASRSGANGS